MTQMKPENLSQMTGWSVIKSLSISKTDLVRACLSIGVSVFDVDVLQREFSQDEVTKVQKWINAKQQEITIKLDKPKKEVKRKSLQQKTPRYYSDEFQVELNEIFVIAKSLGFVLQNENSRLTDRQCAVLEKQLIAGENMVEDESEDRIVEVSGNSDFALALERAIESKSALLSSTKVLKTTAVGYVVTTKKIKTIAKKNGISDELLTELCVATNIPIMYTNKSAKIRVQNLNQVEEIILSLNEVQKYRSTGEKVRISKIARSFSVQTREVRELCEQSGISVISERFITYNSELILLVLLQLKLSKDSKNHKDDEEFGIEKPYVPENVSIDYSSLLLTRQIVHDYNFSNSLMQEVDFSYSNLSDLNFSLSELQRSIFLKVNIKNSDFSFANLEGAVFDFATAENIDFRHADLSGVSFRKSLLKNCSFIGADLSKCNFHDAKSENCDFVGATFEDTKWIGGELVQSCEDLSILGNY